MVGGTLTTVHKTSIYVEDEVDRALSRRAEREGTTKAALIREALRAAAAESLGVKPQARGAFEGPADLAANVDSHLRASGFGEP